MHWYLVTLVWHPWFVWKVTSHIPYKTLRKFCSVVCSTNKVNICCIPPVNKVPFVIVLHLICRHWHKKVKTSTSIRLSLSLSTFFFFSACRDMLLVWQFTWRARDVQHNRHLQSTMNSSEKESEIDNTNHAYISLTPLSMITPKEYCRCTRRIRRYRDGCHNHFCAVLIVIILAASWHRHWRFNRLCTSW